MKLEVDNSTVDFYNNVEFNPTEVDVDNTEVDANNNDLEKSAELFSSLIAVCNEQHLEHCDCQRESVDKEIATIMINEIADMKEKRLDNNTEIWNERLDFARRTAIKKIGKYCEENDIRCPVEKQKIEQHIAYFAKRYELSDPRVYVILDSLLHQMLSAHRMQMHSSSKGILSTYYDKQGNKHYSINPVEDMKLKYDNAKINSIAVLDKIMEGDKVNVVATIDIQENIKNVWEKRKKIIELEGKNGNKSEIKEKKSNPRDTESGH